jgi:hypothetical protein
VTTSTGRSVPSSTVISLTYVSSATRLLDPKALVALLEQVRPRNQERGLTGVLLYRGGNIMQVLEGPAEAVDQTYAAIEADSRHSGLIVMLREPIARRAFPDWSMGFVDATGVDLDREDGFNDFLRTGENGTTGDDPHTHSVAVLLRVFRESMR